jgi:hypothetical protein
MVRVAKGKERTLIRTGMGAARFVTREAKTTVIDDLPCTACSVVRSHTTKADIALLDFTALQIPDHTPRWVLPYVWPVPIGRRHPPQIPPG